MRYFVDNRTTSLMPQQEVWIPYLSLKEQLNLFGVNKRLIWPNVEAEYASVEVS